jgi:zinc protease
MNLEYSYTTLENGLRVIIHQDPSVPIVCINIAYHVGSKDEVPGKTGFAHLFEHLMFDGSVNIPRGAFDRYCEQAGGYNNAYTNEDKTNYYMVLPSNQLALGLWLESDRLLGLDLTKEGLETQRSVVMEEKRQRVDNQPYGTMDEHLAELSYSKHPYSHSIIGSMEDIGSASYEDVTQFHETYYKPNNAVLTLAGDVDHDTGIALVKKYFEDIPTGNTIPRVTVKEPVRLNESRLRVEDKVPLPAVFMAYNICEEQRKDFLALDMLSDLLGHGDSARLHQHLVYEQNIANQASAFIDTREHPGLLMVYAMANPGVTVDELERAVDKEITLVLNDGMNDRELLRIKNKIESSFYQGLHSVSSRADKLSHYGLMYNDPDALNRMMNEYLAKGKDDIINSARKYLGSHNRTVLQYVPSGTE